MSSDTDYTWGDETLRVQLLEDEPVAAKMLAKGLSGAAADGEKANFKL
jgi:hypothetical protein